MRVDRVAGKADGRVVYCGPPGGGKTTNLEQLHRLLAPRTRGRLVKPAPRADRTFRFDFLSVDLGPIRGFHTRLHLYAVPGDDGVDDDRDRILRDADGVVVVADSAPDRQDANRETLRWVTSVLKASGRDPGSVVLALQYNKRDLPEAVAVERLEEDLNRMEAPSFPAVAREGEGVVETLEEVSVRVMRAAGPSAGGGAPP